jgi:hypothetical protein
MQTGVMSMALTLRAGALVDAAVIRRLLLFVGLNTVEADSQFSGLIPAGDRV